MLIRVVVSLLIGFGALIPLSVVALFAFPNDNLPYAFAAACALALLVSIVVYRRDARLQPGQDGLPLLRSLKPVATALFCVAAMFLFLRGDLLHATMLLLGAILQFAPWKPRGVEGAAATRGDRSPETRE